MLACPVLVLSYCWQMDGLPDPDGRILSKVRRYLDTKSYAECGLFADIACLPQTYAFSSLNRGKGPSWSIRDAPVERFGENGTQGPLTVVKFMWDEGDSFENEDEAEIKEDDLISMLDNNLSMMPTCLAELPVACGLQSRSGRNLVLFHGRYIRG